MAQQNSPQTRSNVNSATSVSPLGHESSPKNDSSLYRYVANIYGQKGDTLLRELSENRFKVNATVSITALDDDGFGYHNYESVVECASGATLEDVSNQITSLQESYWSPKLVDDCSATDVSPKYFHVIDYTGEVVLGGRLTSRSDNGKMSNKMNWTHLVRGELERGCIEEDIKALYREAREEALWDNFYTANRLREKASELSWALLRSRVSNSPIFTEEMNKLNRED
ncbi:hypothetical protein B6A42_27025 (plasmid) [Vibrio coralliilyticus]|nr:hypothetical protein B6A42_27025 [Vibrio coralliilyticus]